MRRDLQRRRAREGGASDGSPAGRNQDGDDERRADRREKGAPLRPASAPATTKDRGRTMIARGATGSSSSSSPEKKGRGGSEGKRVGGEPIRGG